MNINLLIHVDNIELVRYYIRNVIREQEIAAEKGKLLTVLNISSYLYYLQLLKYHSYRQNKKKFYITA